MNLTNSIKFKQSLELMISNTILAEDLNSALTRHVDGNPYVNVREYGNAMVLLCDRNIKTALAVSGIRVLRIFGLCVIGFENTNTRKYTHHLVDVVKTFGAPESDVFTKVSVFEAVRIFAEIAKEYRFKMKFDYSLRPTVPQHHHYLSNIQSTEMFPNRRRVPDLQVTEGIKHGTPISDAEIQKACDMEGSGPALFADSKRDFSANPEIKEGDVGECLYANQHRHTGIPKTMEGRGTNIKTREHRPETNVKMVDPNITGDTSLENRTWSDRDEEVIRLNNDAAHDETFALSAESLITAVTLDKEKHGFRMTVGGAEFFFAAHPTIGLAFHVPEDIQMEMLNYAQRPDGDTLNKLFADAMGLESSEVGLEFHHHEGKAWLVVYPEGNSLEKGTPWAEMYLLLNSWSRLPTNEAGERADVVLDDDQPTRPKKRKPGTTKVSLTDTSLTIGVGNQEFPLTPVSSDAGVYTFDGGPYMADVLPAEFALLATLLKANYGGKSEADIVIGHSMQPGKTHIYIDLGRGNTFKGLKTRFNKLFADVGAKPKLETK